MLFAKYKCSNFVKAETNSGTVPVSKLVCKYNSVRLVSVESCDGIDLVRLFSCRPNLRKLIRLDS